MSQPTQEEIDDARELVERRRSTVRLYDALWIYARVAMVLLPLLIAAIGVFFIVGLDPLAHSAIGLTFLMIITGGIATGATLLTESHAPGPPVYRHRHELAKAERDLTRLLLS